MSAPRIILASAIFLPKIIKIGGNLTKFCQKTILHSFLRHGVVITWPWIEISGRNLIRK